MDVTGKALLALSRKHIGERYVLGAQVPKDVPNYKGPWDCAEFASWLVYQVSGKLYGCLDDDAKPSIADAFTGYWAKDANSRGKIVTVQEAAATPGSFLLRRPLEAGIKIGHIVVSDGSGGTVEAHSRVDGVIAGKLAGRVWSYGICVPWFEYQTGAPPESLPAPTEPVLSLQLPPITGGAVRKVQQYLKAAGYNPGKVDGVYGTQTMLAVSAFQQAKGLAPDGEVGSVTLKALKRAAEV